MSSRFRQYMQKFGMWLPDWIRKKVPPMPLPPESKVLEPKPFVPVPIVPIGAKKYNKSPHPHRYLDPLYNKKAYQACRIKSR